MFLFLFHILNFYCSIVLIISSFFWLRSVDFWQMIWEQHSSLVVMLTTESERGRVKCHQYWPDRYDTVRFDRLVVTATKEELTPSFAFRDFTLRHTDVSFELDNFDI